MKLFIQIGAARTGTTFLQKRFYPLHPEVAYMPHVNGWNRWLMALMDEKAKVSVTCEENLTASLGPNFDFYAERLSSSFKDAEIILVTRAFSADLAKSFYVQMVKCGETRNFKDFIASESGKRLNYIYDYEEIIRSYERFFDKGKIHCLPYEMFQHEPDQYFRRLCGILGVNCWCPKNEITNKSISGLQVSTMLRVNPYLKKLIALKKSEKPVATRLLEFSEHQLLAKGMSALAKFMPWGEKAFEGVEEFAASSKSQREVFSSNEDYTKYLSFYK